jgi:RNA polymerase sigma-70 factor (ECF subfamily)
MRPTIVTFEDNVLIEQALAGQTECFTVLIDRHKPAVRRRINSMVRNPADEDDLVQEVFLKAWRRLATFRSEASFRTWIIQVATNEVLQFYRKASRRLLRPAYADLDTFASQCESPHQSLERIEARRTVQSAIAMLPAKYRQILILRELNQLSARETAQWLQSSIPMVKTRLFRARLLLSDALQRPGQRKHLLRKGSIVAADGGSPGAPRLKRSAVG